ncbi:hypothetical protein V3C99_009288, partial [Haemonchus contortus]
YRLPSHAQDLMQSGIMRLGMWTILLFSFVTHGVLASAQHPYDALGNTGLNYEADEGSGEEETPYYMIPYQFLANNLLGAECSTETLTKSKATSAFCVVIPCPCTPEFCFKNFQKAPFSSVDMLPHPCPNSAKSTPLPKKRSTTTIKKIPPKENANRTASRARKVRKSVTRITEKQENAAPLQTLPPGYPFIHYNFFTKPVTPLIVYQNNAPSTVSTTAYEPLQSPKNKMIGRTPTTRESPGVVSQKHQSNSFKKEPSKTTPPKRTITLATILSGRIQTLENPSNSPSKSKSERSGWESSPFHGSAARGERTKRGTETNISRRSQLRILTSKQTSTASPLTARPASSKHEKKWTSGQQQVTTRMMSAERMTRESSIKARNESSLSHGYSSATTTMQGHNSTSKIYSSNTTRSGGFKKTAIDVHITAAPPANPDSSIVAKHNTYLGTPAESRNPSVQPKGPTNPPPVRSVTANSIPLTSGSQSANESAYDGNLTHAKLFSHLIRILSPSPNSTSPAASLNDTLDSMRTGENRTAGSETEKKAPRTTFPWQHSDVESRGPNPVEETAGTGATLLTTSAAATPQYNTTYSSSSTSKPTVSVGADESTTTSERSEKYRSGTSSNTFSSQHSTPSPGVSTKAEHSATSGAYTTTLITSSETMPQSPSISSDLTTSRTTTLAKSTTTSTDTTLPTTSSRTEHKTSTIQKTSATSKHTSLEVAKSTTTSAVAGEHHIATFTSSLASPHSSETPKTSSELTKAEQSTTSDSGTVSTLPTRSSASRHQSSNIYKATQTSKPTPLEATESITTSTVTGENHTATVTSSLLSTHSSESPKNASELTEAEQFTTMCHFLSRYWCSSDNYKPKNNGAPLPGPRIEYNRNIHIIGTSWKDKFKQTPHKYRLEPSFFTLFQEAIRIDRSSSIYNKR